MTRITVFLILFFAVVLASTTVADVQKNDKPPYYLTDEELDAKLGVDPNIESPETFVWVVYFHRVPGCDTCQLMSKYIYETVETRFKNDTKTKELVLRYRNFEDQKNADLAKKLKIQSPSLAVLIIQGGKPIKAKLAGKIWSLAKNQDEFMDYVEKEINTYKKEVQEAKK